MLRSVARKVVWAGRTTPTTLGPELARNGGGPNVPAAGYGVTLVSKPPIRQAGASGKPDGRDAA